MDLKALIDKLSKFYWSKAHPSTYTLTHPVSGAKVGLGVIAHKNYAAFNLTVAIHNGKLNSLSEHSKASSTFGSIRFFLEDGEHDEVSGMLTLLSLEKFRKWYISNAQSVSPKFRPWIEDALTNTKTIHEI